MDILEELNRRPSFAFHNSISQLTLDQLRIAERMIKLKRLICEYGLTKKVDNPRGVHKFRHYKECIYSQVANTPDDEAVCVCCHVRYLCWDISSLLDNVEKDPAVTMTSE